MMFEFCAKDSAVGEGEIMSREICTYVRVKLIARPIEAQNDRARMVRWRDYRDIICSGACRWWRLSFVQWVSGTRQLSLDSLRRQTRGRRLGLSGHGHIELEMWGGETH